jgi:taurine transport system substrate-binding protein
MVKALGKADGDYRKNGKSWTADSAPVKAIAKWSKADPKDVPAAIALYRFPTLQE